MKRDFLKNTKIPVFVFGLLFLVLSGYYLYQNQDKLYYQIHPDLFLAPGKDYESAKKVEDYFVERLHMHPNEAHSIRNRAGSDGMANLRVSNITRLEALIGNLYHYGFIRDEKAFRYALLNTKDNIPGKEGALLIGEGTIDINAEYRISEEMTAWELSDVLLNKPSYFSYDEYGYFFMP